MTKSIDGKALVYADSAFNTPNGKTAHGLVRFTERYEIVGVLDHRYAGQDAGMVLDNKFYNIPVFRDLQEAIKETGPENKPETLVIGLAPDGGRLPPEAKKTIKIALELGMNVDSGLHDFLYKDVELMAIAERNNCRVRDIRRTPDRDKLHFFTGKIEEVDCLKIALLGTDSAIGKRTTAWIIVHAFRKAGMKAEMAGTGQTAWMQGANYCMIMDSCINDFVSGEIEHAVYEAWKNESPDLIVIDGGKGHLNVALKQLKDLGLDIPIIAIAKNEELIYTVTKERPIKLDRENHVLQLIQRLRDEAHRFAIKYHRLLRKKKTLD